MLEVLFELGKLLCAFPTPIQDIIPPIQSGKCNPNSISRVFLYPNYIPNSGNPLRQLAKYGRKHMSDFFQLRLQTKIYVCTETLAKTLSLQLWIGAFFAIYITFCTKKEVKEKLVLKSLFIMSDFLCNFCSQQRFPTTHLPESTPFSNF